MPPALGVVVPSRHNCVPSGCGIGEVQVIVAYSIRAKIDCGGGKDAVGEVPVVSYAIVMVAQEAEVPTVALIQLGAIVQEGACMT